MFINTIAKTRYDNKYLLIKIKKELLIYLRLHYRYSISRVNPKLLNQRVELFKILKKIENLIYRLELFITIRIYLVISIV